MALTKDDIEKRLNELERRVAELEQKPQQDKEPKDGR